MKKYLFILYGLLSLPFLAFAQAPASSLQFLITNTIGFLNSTVIYFLLGIAFLIFVINAIRYFVVESTNEEGRNKARALALYSILAFVIIIIFWGIVNLLALSFGLANPTPPPIDFCTMFGPPGTPGTCI